MTEILKISKGQKKCLKETLKELSSLRTSGVATLEACSLDAIMKYLKNKGVIFISKERSDVPYWVPMLHNLYNTEKIINLPVKNILKDTFIDHHRKLSAIPILLECMRYCKYCSTYQRSFNEAKEELLQIFKDYPILLDIKIKGDKHYIDGCLIRLKEFNLLERLIQYQCLSSKFYLK